MWVAFAVHIFSANNINVFSVLLDSNFNVTLANNFVKFWTFEQPSPVGLLYITPA